MPVVKEFIVKKRTRQVDGGAVSTTSRNDVSKTTWTPSSKVSGSFITFPDGSKFRRATSYSKSTSWIEPKSPEYTETLRKYTGRTGFENVSAGGYRADELFTGNMCYKVAAPAAGNINVPPSINSSMRNECETKALLALADAKANIGENLATLSHIIRLVKDPLTTLTKELKKVKSERSLLPFFRKSYRDIFRDGKGLDPVAREYLKYVYGWKPLMQDIHGIMELAKAAGRRPLLIHADGKSSRMEALNSVNFKNISEGIRTITYDATAKSKARCNIWAKPDPNWSGSRTLNQLGLLNPASLAWELVPASFVVDWVLPIGPVLQALTATAGLTFVDGSTSQRVSARWAYDQFYAGDYTITSQRPASGLAAYEGYVREKLSNWPRPGFWFDPDPLRLRSDGSDRIFKFLALSLLSLK